MDGRYIIHIPEPVETPIKPPNLEVKEAYVQNVSAHSGQNPPAGVLSKIAGTIQNLFRWRKMPIKNARVTPESGSNFLDAERAEISGAGSTVTATGVEVQTDNIRMNRLDSKPSEESFQMQLNFDQSFQSGFLDNSGVKTFDKTEQYPGNESKLFSVNSAGNPIPLTIENDKNDDSSDDSSSGEYFYNFA